MLFKPGTPLYSYEVSRETGNQVMYVNYLGALEVPNLAENPDIMYLVQIINKVLIIKNKYKVQ